MDRIADERPLSQEAATRGAVRVHAPARLHFGFLDLHGGLGRRFGSIGLAVDAPSIDLTARPAAALRVDGFEAGRARGYAEAAARHLGIAGHAALQVDQAIPAHAGFGSGTQLALSVAAAAGRPRRAVPFHPTPLPMSSTVATGPAWASPPSPKAG